MAKAINSCLVVFLTLCTVFCFAARRWRCLWVITWLSHAALLSVLGWLTRARNYGFCRTHELYRSPQCDRHQQLAVLIEFDLTEFHFYSMFAVWLILSHRVLRAVRLLAGFNCGCPSTILGLSIWDLWREIWHMDRTSPFTRHCTVAT